MNYVRDYKGTIWTNHALERLKQRGILQSDAWVVWRNPDSKRYAESKGAWVYYKTWGSTRYEIVAKENNRGQWIILSVWIKELTGKQDSEKRTGFIASLKSLFGL